MGGLFAAWPSVFLGDQRCLVVAQRELGSLRMVKS